MEVELVEKPKTLTVELTPSEAAQTWYTIRKRLEDNLRSKSGCFLSPEYEAALMQTLSKLAEKLDEFNK